MYILLQAHPGTDWAPVGVTHKAKYESVFNTDEKGCDYEAGANPYEASKDMILRHLWMEQQKVLEGPWKPGGVDKPLSQPPGPQMQGDIIASVQRLLEEDWEDAVVNIFENQDGHWVVRFDLETVDSEQGLATYMNVFLRCNALVTKYGLQRVRGLDALSPAQHAWPSRCDDTATHVLLFVLPVCSLVWVRAGDGALQRQARGRLHLLHPQAAVGEDNHGCLHPAH